MDSRLKERLKLVTNPVTKLELMIKHGLVEEAAALIADHAQRGYAYFTEDVNSNDDRNATVFFDTLTQVQPPGGLINTGDDDQMKRVEKYLNRVCVLIALNPEVEKSPHITIDFEGMIAFFKWDREQAVMFVRQAVEKIIAVEPVSMGWRHSRAMAHVIRNYLPAEDTFTKTAEIWLLRVHLRRGRTFELRRDALPTPMENAKDERNELDPIVDRFVELGWSVEQTKAEIFERIKGAVGNCRPQFMIALAGAKCFTYDDYETGELGQLLREKYRPGIWQDLVTSSNGSSFLVEMYMKLLRCGLRGEKKSEEKSFYRSEFIKLLSEGKLNRVWQLIVLLGSRVLFYAEMERSVFEKATAYVKELVPEVFAMAYRNAHYGVAAALKQEFGSEACYDDKPLVAEAEAFVKVDNESVSEEYADVEEKYHNGEPDKYFKTGRGKKWRDACDAIEAKRAAKLEELRRERKEQIAEVTSIAVDLEQPVRFVDMFVYYHSPEWPKH